MIRDRGNKKWVAMMLPEHVQMLRELDKELDKEEKPYVDEYTFAEWEERIHYAMEAHLPVQFRVWEAGHFHMVIGTVHYINAQSRKYTVEVADGFEYVLFQSVVGVEIYEGTDQ